jgi:hypothetical protein
MLSTSPTACDSAVTVKRQTKCWKTGLRSAIQAKSFFHTASRFSTRYTQNHIQWVQHVPILYRKAAEEWGWPLASTECTSYDHVEASLHSNHTPSRCVSATHSVLITGLTRNSQTTPAILPCSFTAHRGIDKMVSITSKILFSASIRLLPLVL